MRVCANSGPSLPTQGARSRPEGWCSAAERWKSRRSPARPGEEAMFTVPPDFSFSSPRSKKRGRDQEGNNQIRAERGTCPVVPPTGRFSDSFRMAGFGTEDICALGLAGGLSRQLRDDANPNEHETVSSRRVYALRIHTLIYESAGFLRLHKSRLLAATPENYSG